MNLFSSKMQVLLLAISFNNNPSVRVCTLRPPASAERQPYQPLELDYVVSQ
jgi:hypothetical protein